MPPRKGRKAAALAVVCEEEDQELFLDGSPCGEEAEPLTEAAFQAEPLTEAAFEAELAALVEETREEGALTSHSTLMHLKSWLVHKAVASRETGASHASSQLTRRLRAVRPSSLLWVPSRPNRPGNCHRFN
jgi:hypothetical protein